MSFSSLISLCVYGSIVSATHNFLPSILWLCVCVCSYSFRILFLLASNCKVFKRYAGMFLYLKKQQQQRQNFKAKQGNNNRKYMTIVLDHSLSLWLRKVFHLLLIKWKNKNRFVNRHVFSLSIRFLPKWSPRNMYIRVVVYCMFSTFLCSPNLNLHQLV